MSDSRLEKFIYAICSMDVSDLPAPLSRIEKLWNCLITGETPDFEPLSRNEKYLMAMLDRYDISNLPAPMSRGEKLLYKIAVGETDLSDVPGYLSRYEELLKYLIENGGISGGDFEYVLHTINQSLYTLYTTAKKPVKSAILKGNTLVSLTKAVFGNGRVNKQYGNIASIKLELLKPSTKYIAYIFNDGEEDVELYWNSSANFQWKTFVCKSKAITYSIGASKADFNDNELVFSVQTTQTLPQNLRCVVLEYQEGMENWDIPYFEGMQSVKMPVLTTTGENLIDSEIIAGWLNTSNGEINNLTSTTTCATKDLIKVKPATQYSVYKEYDKRVLYAQFNEKQEFINFGTYTHNGFTTDSNAVYVRLFFETPVNEELKVILYEGGYNSNISYEPYKSNILTVNEDVTLRGIGDVKDELNCLTGEVTRRVGYANINTFVPSPYYKPLDDGGYMAVIGLENKKSTTNLMSNLGIPIGGINSGDFGMYNNPANIVIFKKGCTLEEITSIINQIEIMYELATESVKTVDLTVVDQDNQPTQLGTFENITHVKLESAGLIPTVKMEVATRISKELASASPLMDDISTNQQQLNTTVDEQSNNVDATMIATTEIYEETL